MCLHKFVKSVTSSVPVRTFYIEEMLASVRMQFHNHVDQRRSQNEAEEAMPPSPKKLRWCFISISTVRKQTEGTVGLM